MGFWVKLKDKLKLVQTEDRWGLYCLENDAWLTNLRETVDGPDEIVTYNISPKIQHYDYGFASQLRERIVKFNKNFDDPFFNRRGVKVILVPIKVKYFWRTGFTLSVDPIFSQASETV